ARRPQHAIRATSVPRARPERSGPATGYSQARWRHAATAPDFAAAARAATATAPETAPCRPPVPVLPPVPGYVVALRRVRSAVAAAQFAGWPVRRQSRRAHHGERVPLL